jgi:hypothetical protein
MKHKIISTVVALVLLLGLLSIPAQAASEEDINNAISNGVAWLAADQEPDGSWPAYWEDVATTGLAVLKLEHRAYELGYDSPFDPAYEYSDNVIAGLDYLFGSANLFTQSIGTQDHTGGASGSIDDPDSNANGKGVYAHGHSYPFDVYDTGIVLSAIAASGTPSRVVNVTGSPVDGWTYFDVAQDMVDWLAWAQSDFDYAPNSAGEGGWSYGALDNDDQMGSFGPDNSNSGYAVLGLAYAEGFGCTVPQWVKTELNAYVADIQDPVDGDANDGGSWYAPGYYGIPVNILKTGNLIMEMALVGDTPTTPRVIDALDYLARHWGDASGANSPPGWDGNPAQYQAMFCAMKGLEYMGIDTFNSIDWYADFSDNITAQQTTTAGPDFGSWQSSSGRGNPTIITAWALLILEKTAPPPVEDKGFMTGGGNIVKGKGKNAQRYTWGFEIRCDGSQGNFQYNDHAQKGKFHLESITSVTCSDDPAIDPNPPKASFDTLTMIGTGRWNGVSGATIEVTLTDAGQPGRNDTIDLEISVAGSPVSSISGNLDGGNHQAHDSK